jgi:hypothetical protein
VWGVGDCVGVGECVWGGGLRVRERVCACVRMLGNDTPSTVQYSA